MKEQFTQNSKRIPVEQLIFIKVTSLDPVILLKMIYNTGNFTGFLKNSLEQFFFQNTYQCLLLNKFMLLLSNLLQTKISCTKNILHVIYSSLPTQFGKPSLKDIGHAKCFFCAYGVKLKFTECVSFTELKKTRLSTRSQM